MNDVYMEYMLKKKKSGLQIAIISIVIALGVVLTCALLLVIFALGAVLAGTQWGSFTFSIGFVLIAFMWYGAYLILGMQNVEYEYTLTNNELDIDKILSKRGRKSIVSIDFKEITICANVEDNEHNHDYKNVTMDKTYDLTGDKSRGSVYFVDFNNDGQRTRVLFQPTSKMMGEIRKFNPRNIFVMED